MRSLALKVAAALAALATLVPAQDFGDAPQGGATGYPTGFPQVGAFPSCLSANGARTANFTATLGPSATSESDCLAVDVDNGLVSFLVMLTSIPATARMQVQVDSNTGGQYFLNVLIDLDMNAQWGGATSAGHPEWVVFNHPVNVAQNSSTIVEPPPFLFGNGNILPDGAWMRVALTRQPILGSDWTGTGSFAHGEIEDYALDLPDDLGSGTPKKKPRATMRCPGRVFVPVKSGRFKFGGCTIKNVSCKEGTFEYGFDYLNGGVNQVGLAPCDPNPGCVTFKPGESKNLRFVANRNGDLPSRWTYWVRCKAPKGEQGAPPGGFSPTINTRNGVIVGVQDPLSIVEFYQDDTPGALLLRGLDKGLQRYRGSSPITAMTAFNGGVLTAFERAGPKGFRIHWSPNGQDLGGGTPHYDEKSKVTALAAYKGGVLAAITDGPRSHRILWAKDSTKIAAGDVRYSGSSPVIAIVPFRNGVLTAFSNAGKGYRVHWSADGKNLGGGPTRYDGKDEVTAMVEHQGGVLTAFRGQFARIHWSPSGTALAEGRMVYRGVSPVTAITPYKSGVASAFRNAGPQGYRIHYSNLQGNLGGGELHYDGKFLVPAMINFRGGILVAFNGSQGNTVRWTKAAPELQPVLDPVSANSVNVHLDVVGPNNGLALMHVGQLVPGVLLPGIGFWSLGNGAQPLLLQQMPLGRTRYSFRVPLATLPAARAFGLQALTYAKVQGFGATQPTTLWTDRVTPLRSLVAVTKDSFGANKQLSIELVGVDPKKLRQVSIVRNRGHFVNTLRTIVSNGRPLRLNFGSGEFLTGDTMHAILFRPDGNRVVNLNPEAGACAKSVTLGVKVGGVCARSTNKLHVQVELFRGDPSKPTERAVSSKIVDGPGVYVLSVPWPDTGPQPTHWRIRSIRNMDGTDICSGKCEVGTCQDTAQNVRFARIDQPLNYEVRCDCKK